MTAPLDVLALLDKAIATDELVGASLEWLAKMREARAAVAELIDTHKALLDRYTALVNCGDCGNWNPEEEAEIINSRAALARVGGAA